MRRVSRFLLGIVTSAIPVVIAACYGVAYRFSQHGRVIDKNSKSGVSGLRVECRNARNGMSDMTYSAADGAFDLYATDATSCATIAIEDDREAGPHYAPATVKPNPGHDVVVEVTLAP